MRFVSSTPPNVAKVCGKDDSRPILTRAFLDVAAGTLSATDSYKLVQVPVEVDEGDVSGMVPSEALAAFYKVCRSRRAVSPALKCGEGTITLGDSYNATSQSWSRPADGSFPDCARLIPEESDRSGFRVRFNAKFLLELAAGLGGDDVTLTFVRSPNTIEEGDAVGFFPSNMRPIIVENGSPDHGIGILMPIRIAG